MKLFHDQSPPKYWAGPGSNWLSLDLQADSDMLPDTLPTALRGPVNVWERMPMLNLNH